MSFEFYENVYHRDIGEYGAEGAIILAHLRFRQQAATRQTLNETEGKFWFAISARQISAELRMGIETVKRRMAFFASLNLLTKRKDGMLNCYLYHLDAQCLESVYKSREKDSPGACQNDSVEEAKMASSGRVKRTPWDVSNRHARTTLDKQGNKKISFLTETIPQLAQRGCEKTEKTEWCSKKTHQAHTEEKSDLKPATEKIEERDNQTGEPRKKSSSELKNAKQREPSTQGSELWAHYEKLMSEHPKYCSVLLARNRRKNTACKNLVEEHGLEKAKLVVEMFLKDWQDSRIVKSQHCISFFFFPGNLTNYNSAVSSGKIYSKTVLQNLAQHQHHLDENVERIEYSNPFFDDEDDKLNPPQGTRFTSKESQGMTDYSQKIEKIVAHLFACFNNTNEELKKIYLSEMKRANLDIASLKVACRQGVIELKFPTLSTLLSLVHIEQQEAPQSSQKDTKNAEEYICEWAEKKPVGYTFCATSEAQNETTQEQERIAQNFESAGKVCNLSVVSVKIFPFQEKYFSDVGSYKKQVGVCTKFKAHVFMQKVG